MTGPTTPDGPSTFSSKIFADICWVSIGLRIKLALAHADHDWLPASEPGIQHVKLEMNTDSQVGERYRLVNSLFDAAPAPPLPVVHVAPPSEVSSSGLLPRPKPFCPSSLLRFFLQDTPETDGKNDTPSRYHLYREDVQIWRFLSPADIHQVAHIPSWFLRRWMPSVPSTAAMWQQLCVSRWPSARVLTLKQSNPFGVPRTSRQLFFERSWLVDCNRLVVRPEVGFTYGDYVSTVDVWHRDTLVFSGQATLEEDDSGDGPATDLVDIRAYPLAPSRSDIRKMQEELETQMMQDPALRSDSRSSLVPARAGQVPVETLRRMQHLDSSIDDAFRVELFIHRSDSAVLAFDGSVSLYDFYGNEVTAIPSGMQLNPSN